MQILEGLEALDDAAPETGSATLVGVFDGVHLGHQRLLHELRELAASQGLLPTVVTFRNHPAEFLRGRRVEWIVDLPHRLRLLRRAGVGRVLLLEFDERIRDMDAERFSRRILQEGLRTGALLLGYDSAIGKNREGTPARLRDLGDRFGFSVQQGTPFEIDGSPASSTQIREAIRAGRLAEARRMLGRWPGAMGPIEPGDGRGRGLGFATANVKLASVVLPPPGVYAVEALLGSDDHPGVAHLGARPSIDADEPPRLEVHLLDGPFDDLYGQVLEVQFLSLLREPRRFDDLNDLKGQIAIDSDRAREALRGHGDRTRD